MADSATIMAQAEAGDTASQYALARAWHAGTETFSPDIGQALSWYRRAAELGHVPSQLQLGLIYLNGVPERPSLKNAPLALELLSRAAEQGNGEAMHALAQALWQGKGLDKDKAAGLDWYVKAARTGHGPALHQLGMMALNGEGVRQNAEKAVDCFRRAAERGYVHSQFNLALCMLKGEGGPVDLPGARRWLTAAAEQDHIQAQYNLGILLREGGEGFSADPAASFAWFQRSASKDDPNSLYQLGQCYRNGEGCLADPVKALVSYRCAADKGHREAMFSLGLMVERAVFNRPGDPVLAAQWYAKASARGHAGAAHNLGILYAKGSGVPQDGGMARRMFEHAIAGGEDGALYSLALLTFAGAYGLAADPVESRKWALLSQRLRPQEGGETLLEELARVLTPAQMAQSDQRAAAWTRHPVAQQTAEAGASA